MLSRQVRVLALVSFGFTLAGTESVHAAIVSGDALEVALEPNDAVNFRENSFDVFAADALAYDDNIYRLTPGTTDLNSLPGIGLHAKRQDYIDTASLGLDGTWSRGRQTVAVDLRADVNRYSTNKDLNNVSNSDKIKWNWSVGNVLSGQIGAIYNSGLISFVNSTFYGRSLYAVTSYFATGRYQFGPHWAVFAGGLDSRTTLSNSASLRANDLHTKSADFGSELALGVKDSLRLEYRYSDTTSPAGAALNGDYHEDAGRFAVKHEFSDKTDVNANVGFLKRTYSSTVIPGFSGNVWRLDAHWQPTDKLRFEAGVWRNLQAYLTAQSDYYVDRGERISPQWAVSEKIAIAVAFSFENQDYIGVGAGELVQGARRDSLTSSQASIKYTPFNFLIFDVGYAYEKRKSNEFRFQFNDNIISAKVTVKL